MDDVIEMLKRAGAILEGHFIGNSGRHLSTYINKDAFLPKTSVVSEIGRMFAEANKDKDVDIVAGPAVGGIPLSQWTAHHLSSITGKEVLSIFTEKTPDNRQVLNRGYDVLVSGKRVLAVEDTVTTGGSVRKSIEAIRAAGGHVVQLSLIVNRDPERITESAIGVPTSALAELPMESWAEGDVPDWLKAIPINTQFGHGAKYLKENGMAQ